MVEITKKITKKKYHNNTCSFFAMNYVNILLLCILRTDIWYSSIKCIQSLVIIFCVKTSYVKKLFYLHYIQFCKQDVNCINM